MTDQTLLAAVHAAAQSPVPAAQAAPPQSKEISMSAPEKTAGQSAEVKPTTAAELAAAFPDLVSSIRAEASTAGATAERARITGIDGLAANRKGLGALVTEMKADATCTVEKAAMRILDHEGKQLAARAANIAGVEEVASVVKAAPSASGAGAEQESTTASSPDEWKAEYGKNKQLQQEFGSAERYVAYKQGVADGTVRILAPRATA